MPQPAAQRAPAVPSDRPDAAIAVADASATAAVVPYAAEICADVEAFLARCAALTGPASNPFSRPGWLRAWYATLGCAGGRRPLLLAVRRADSGADVLLWPLVSRRRFGLSIVEPADATVVDYVAPVVAADWSAGAAPAPAAQQLWRALRRALRGHDVLRVEKMLGHALDEDGGARNPLLDGLRAVPGALFGNAFSVGDDWQAWRRSLDARVRKEIERCWRVFERSPVARFERVTDLSRAHELFDVLQAQQSLRMRQAQRVYRLDDAPYRAFYRQLLDTGLADGSVVLCVLLDGDAVVATVFGVANADRFIALRHSLAADGWKQCSPGRLVNEGAARQLHAAGLRHFDFGIGDYRHKDALRTTRRPLHDACRALSWRGLPVVAAWHLRRWLRQQPTAVASWRRLRGLLGGRAAGAAATSPRRSAG